MRIKDKYYRTIWFENNLVKIIDQTKLPHQFIIKGLNNPEAPEYVIDVKGDITLRPKE